ncbi:hypothetical protein [Fructilactobacillus carniphilus]|uniref:Uncharacterized protein n=1 Tax=Fructilactobacillus carniphilus TaxID=2940297 RepID=A0ABY5BVH6_9LACO|nr:hypothetical protein [Fructilactobacillus carniphilus]USS90342.1 hypothetical protein M3M37_05735 [Fructilactobacillus carniphilus]
MEYSNWQYFLYKLGSLFNSSIFNLIAAILIVIVVTVLFIYDFQNHGPILSSNKNRSNENVDNERGKHSGRKHVFRNEVLLGVALIVILAIMFVSRSSLAKVDSPFEINNSSKTKIATKGKVVWMKYNNGSLGINADDHKGENAIVAQINNVPIPTDAPVVTPYKGTMISNNEFLKLNPGDDVEIKYHPYQFKYKNHAQFGNDKAALKQITLLNRAKVNGYVEKYTPKQVTKKQAKTHAVQSPYAAETDYY